MAPYEPATAGRSLRSDARRNRARILQAAEEVFAAKGPAASTEEIARRAGVGVGTLFRHFPTKEELLRAITGELAARLAEDTGSLARDGDPATAFFTFFTAMVERSTRAKTVIDLLAEADVPITVAKPVHSLRHGIEELLTRAQRAGTVRDDVSAPEVIALLIAVCQAALHADWSPDLQTRTLTIIFDGLSP